MTATRSTRATVLSGNAGGGTHVEPLGRTLRYDVGHVCCHAGEVRHAGAEVESGVRYALVCFVDSAAVFEPARALSNEGDARRLRAALDARGLDTAADPAVAPPVYALHHRGALAAFRG